MLALCVCVLSGLRVVCIPTLVAMGRVCSPAISAGMVRACVQRFSILVFQSQCSFWWRSSCNVGSCDHSKWLPAHTGPLMSPSKFQVYSMYIKSGGFTHYPWAFGRARLWHVSSLAKDSAYLQTGETTRTTAALQDQITSSICMRGLCAAGMRAGDT